MKPRREVEIIRALFLGAILCGILSVFALIATGVVPSTPELQGKAVDSLRDAQIMVIPAVVGYAVGRASRRIDNNSDSGNEKE